MKTGFFNSSLIKPLVKASAQNAAFVDGDIVFDWTGFEIPDEFVVGYGIDYAQRNRNLPYIGKVKFTE